MSSLVLIPVTSQAAPRPKRRLTPEQVEALERYDVRRVLDDDGLWLVRECPGCHTMQEVPGGVTQTDLDVAVAHFARADYLCVPCQRKAEAIRPHAKPVYIRVTRGGASGSCEGSCAPFNPGRRKQHTPRPRKASRRQQVKALWEAYELYQDFLDAVASGAETATAECVRRITAKRDDVVGQLRALGATL